MSAEYAPEISWRNMTLVSVDQEIYRYSFSLADTGRDFKTILADAKAQLSHKDDVLVAMDAEPVKVGHKRTVNCRVVRLGAMMIARRTC